MGLFNRQKPATDRHWTRLQELTADVEQLRSASRGLQSEWAEVLTRINKAIQRLERAQERQDRKAATPVESSQIVADLPGAPEAHSFVRKLSQVNGGRS